MMNNIVGFILSVLIVVFVILIGYIVTNDVVVAHKECLWKMCNCTLDDSPNGCYEDCIENGFCQIVSVGG